MAEPVVAYPSLHSRSNPYVKEPGKVALALIRFMFMNPGASSGFMEEEMISFRKMVGSKQHTPDELAEDISTALTEAMARYFPDAEYQAVANVVWHEGKSDDGSYAGNYGIDITIGTPEGAPICPNTHVKTRRNGDEAIINVL